MKLNVTHFKISIYASMPSGVVYYLLIIVFVLSSCKRLVLGCSFPLAPLEAQVLVGGILLGTRVQPGARLLNTNVLFVTTKCNA